MEMLLFILQQFTPMILRKKKFTFETNVEGTRNILKVCDEKNIQSVIFTSSVAVYGFTQDLMQMKHLKQIHLTIMENQN